jgi:hypothetical protein
MQNDGPPRRIAFEKGIRIGGQGWFGRLLAVVVGGVVFVAAALLSVVLFAVLFVVGAIIVGYLWWKMRALRKQAEAFRNGGFSGGPFRGSPLGDDPFGDDGRTIDMEVVHKDTPEDDSAKR